MHVLSFDFQSDVTFCDHVRFFNVNLPKWGELVLSILVRRNEIS